MLTKDNKLLFIGQVAAQSGIPIQTIRYYDELGLLKLSGRSKGGFRQFSEEVFSRLTFIKQAQRLGLSLEEVGELLRICEQRKPLRKPIQVSMYQAPCVRRESPTASRSHCNI